MTDLLQEILAELRKLNARLDDAGSPLMTKGEAARFLGVSKSRTLSQWIAEGKIRCLKVGSRLKIPRAELERMLEMSPRKHGT